MILAAALFVQQSGFLDVYGIAPNLILIMFTALVIGGARWQLLVLLLAGLLVYGGIAESFWISEFALFAGVVALGRAIRDWLTGTAIVDFFILLTGSSCVLYGLRAALHLSPFSFSAFMGDVVYTACCGGVWCIAMNYGKKIDSI